MNLDNYFNFHVCSSHTWVNIFVPASLFVIGSKAQSKKWSPTAQQKNAALKILKKN